jgi:hypothetical protein|tara:strand:- start:2076 stop:2420 length:345 start_codon:yes stop_codon:yes gene_type:complete
MRLFIALALVLFLGGCLSPLSLLGGGGPNVAANVQAGKENNQSVIDQSSDITGENVSVDNSQVSSNGPIESIKVLNQDIPTWVIILLILGWMLPSPQEIWRGFLKTITLGRYRG